MKKSRYTKKYERVLASLREVRKAAGLTQTEVAKKFGAHASFVSKCESGERRIDIVELADFCRVYGISLADFLRRAELD
ncbi:MAG: helix-turn-helix domain-containing protein [Planctomycetaceae bacterium]